MDLLGSNTIFGFKTRRFRASCCLLIALMCGESMTIAFAESPINPKIKVVESNPHPALTVCFKREDGWTGADGAYSIKVNKDRTLWFFGDTWIGPIKGGKRVDSHNWMVHNTAAFQTLSGKADQFQFFWKAAQKKPSNTDKSFAPKPSDLFVPEQSNCYYWPGDGAYIDGKLYVFMHLIKNKPEAPPPFQFEQIGDDLLQIENPLDDASKWRWKRLAVSRTVNGANFGISCLTDSQYLYSYCSYPAAKSGLNVHPLIVARIKKDNLADLFKKKKSARTIESQWEYLCEHDSGWKRSLNKPKILIPDAAPEMSISRVHGIDGYVATYMPPMDHSIYLRFSKTPEGPFAERVLAYKCPDSEKWMLLYSAKAHPELAKDRGELIVTYCRNTEDFGFHQKLPYIYAPQAVRVVIETTAR